jgi:hypothetical protein
MLIILQQLPFLFSVFWSDKCEDGYLSRSGNNPYDVIILMFKQMGDIVVFDRRDYCVENECEFENIDLL